MRILEEEKKPLSATDIWEIAKTKGYDNLLHSQGKTPWATLGAYLYCNVRDRKDSPFIKVGTRPKLFHLKKLASNDELKLIEQAKAMAQKYGKWIVARSLSEGGQAVTFLAYREDDPEKRQCVLKRFKNPDRVKRYESEVAAALSLDHPNLVKYVDSDLKSAKPFMVTEYYSGGPLSRGNFDNWSTIERLQLFRAICDGVGYAHSQGIIHRDLKPDNIFLHKDGKTPVVGDFGICFISEEGTRFTLTDEAVGARRFTAPELEDGRAGQVSARSDVYSLGKILYWLFAKRVFDREKHREPQWSLTNKQQDLSSVLIA